MKDEDFDKLVGSPNQEMDGIVLPQAQEIRTHDHLGLSLDPENWADEKCKTCNGRGVFKTTVAVKASEIVPGATGGQNTTQVTEPCWCAKRRYQKVMLTLQEKVLAVWNHPGVSEEKKLDGIAALVKEAHAQIKNAGKVTDVKALVKAADAAARSLINKPTVGDIVRANNSRRRR